MFDPKTGFKRPAVHSDVPPTRIRWRRLLARVFSVDLTRCPLCEGRLNIIEAVVEPARIAVLLEQRRDTQAKLRDRPDATPLRSGDTSMTPEPVPSRAWARADAARAGPPTIGRARWSR